MIISEVLLKKIMKLKGFELEKEIAALLGLSPPDFSARKKKGTLLPLILEWAINENVNLDYLFHDSVGHKQEANGNGILQGHHIEAKEIHIDLHAPGFVAEAKPYYRRKEDHDQELSEIIHLLEYDVPEAKSLILKVLRGKKAFKEGLQQLGQVNLDGGG